MKIKILAGFGNTPDRAAQNVEELFEEWRRENPTAQIISTQIAVSQNVTDEYYTIYLKIEWSA